MSTKLKAGTASSGAVLDADTAGILELQTGSTPTTAVTIDASQNVTTSANTYLATSSGKVGIGTSSPSQKFVVANAGGDNIIMAENTSSTVKVFLQADSSIGKCWTLTNYPLSLGTNNTEYARIDTAGSVAIGTTSTASATRLTVYGSGTGSNTLATYKNSAGTTLVSIAENANSWASGSDPRLKNIIGNYSSALNDIAQIKSIKFTWKHDSTNAPQVGVDATTVELVVPEAISKAKLLDGDNTEYLTVKYQDLIPLMIASIQELNAKVTALEAQLGAK